MQYFVRFQVLTAASTKFRFILWDVLPCKIIALMMEAARISEMLVNNYFTRQYIPLDKSELHAVFCSLEVGTIFLNTIYMSYIPQGIKEKPVSHLLANWHLYSEKSECYLLIDIAIKSSFKLYMKRIHFSYSLQCRTVFWPCQAVSRQLLTMAAWVCLWWTKWHWDRFFCLFFSFPLSASFHHGSPYSYIIWG
jgi:hypothetical protein